MNMNNCSIILLAMASAGSLFAQDQPAESKSNLQQLFMEAEQLADDEQTREQAARKYHEVIQRHLANDKVFYRAMREVAKHYEETGNAETGIREFYRMMNDKEIYAARYETLQGILEQYSRKHPELVKKVGAEIQQAEREKNRTPAMQPVKDLLSEILQREDLELRNAAVEQLKKTLKEDSSVSGTRSALITLNKALTAKFDHESFYPLVAPLIDSGDVGIRIMVITLLPRVGGTADDLPKIAEHTADPSSRVRSVVGSSLISIGQGKHEGVVIPALMELLQDDEQSVVNDTIRSMWGQYTSPEFDELLIELSNQPVHHHNAIYFCLSTIREKSPAVCQRLVEELNDPDWNNSGRAAWGLTYGVTEEAKQIVEDGLLKALPEETNAYTRKQEFIALRTVATDKSRDYLESVVNSKLETEEFKNLAREALKAID